MTLLLVSQAGLSVSSPEEGIVATSSCQHMHVLFPPVVESPAEIKRQRVPWGSNGQKYHWVQMCSFAPIQMLNFRCCCVVLVTCCGEVHRFVRYYSGVLCNAYILVQQCTPVQECCCTDERGKHARFCCAGGLIAHCALGRTDTGYILPLLAYDITATAGDSRVV